MRRPTTLLLAAVLGLAACGRMTLDPRRKNAIKLTNHAVELYRQGLLAPAVRELKGAIAEDDAYVMAHYNLAKIYQEMGNWEDAAAEMNKCLALEPDVPLYHYDLGVAYQESKQIDLAEQEYRKAIAGDDRMYTAHYRLGTILEERGRHGDADRAYRKAIEINARFAKPFVKLGYLYLDHDFVKESVAVFRAGAQVHDAEAELHNGLGRALAEQHEHDAAIRSFETALEIDKELLGAIYNLGMTYAAKGDKAKAQQYLQQFADRAQGRASPEYVKAAQDKISEILGQELLRAGDASLPARLGTR